MTEFAGDWHTITDIARQTNQGLIGWKRWGQWHWTRVISTWA